MTNVYDKSGYVGPVNDKGWHWHGDLECYESPENWTTIRVYEEEGRYKVWYVFFGNWTHEVQVKELDATDDLSEDEKQKVYEDWYHNRKATGRCATDPERWRRENAI